MIWQAIPHGIWTRLDGYDAEILQDTGANIAVAVVDGKLVTNPTWAAEKCKLRPAQGYTAPFTAPFTGRWVFEA